MSIKIKTEELITLEDGYVYWWPTDFPHGCFQSHTLREIADQLDEMNKAWDAQVIEALAKY